MKSQTSSEKTGKLKIPRDWDREMAALIQSAKPKPDKIPPGWRTRAQWSQHLKLPRYVIKTRLQLLLKSGAVEVRRFRVMGTQGIVSIPHYRMK
jgi:hypothetical protein